MSDRNDPGVAVQRPWDARLAHRLVAPLRDSWVVPITDHGSSVGRTRRGRRLFIEELGWSNLAAPDGAPRTFWIIPTRLAGSARDRFGHLYDLGSDAVVTIAVFVAIGVNRGPSGRFWIFPLSMARSPAVRSH
jgi:hypothetical protein